MSEGLAGLAEQARQNGQSVLRLLILEESASGAQVLIDPLRQIGYAVTAARVKSPLEFQVALKKQEWDIVLVPVQLASFPAKQAIALLKHAKADIPVVIISKECTDEEMIDALQHGAGAVVRTNNPAQLQLVIDRELRDLAHRRARHYYEHMFRESERRCHALLESAHHAIACMRAGKIIYGNPAFKRLIKEGDGDTPALTALIHADDRQAFVDTVKRINHQIANVDRLELRLSAPDGRYCKTVVEVSLAHINGQQCVQLVFTPDGDTQPAAVSAPAAVRQDTNGLVSAGEILGTLDSLLKTKKIPALAFAHIELDRFETLYDHLGTEQAETIVQAVADLIMNAVGGEAKLSRPSAHTFNVLLPRIESAAAENLANTIREDIANQTWPSQGQNISLTCSIGISLPSAATKQGIAVLAEADNACQFAKQAGGNRVQIADATQKSSPRGEDQALATRQRVRNALANNRFRIVYQPIVNLHAQPFECYDVLTRMLDDAGKELMPADFMPAAEQAGLMTALDRWVIQAALRILATQRANQKETSFIIKLSADSLSDPTLVPWLAKQFQELHVPGDTVIFEIKETCAAHRLPATKQLIQSLKQLGCRTALGQFGTDPRSLDHLEQLRVDFVKLASSFVDKLPGDLKEELPIKSVVQAAHDLGILTIATCVQEASKMTALWQCNVDYILGFFLQAPEQDLSYNFNENA